ncbi:MAG: C1 family peptidase [Pirellulales bacterium]|nr:C1 family peptidase [Pirellulales bacterium]
MTFRRRPMMWNGFLCTFVILGLTHCARGADADSAPAKINNAKAADANGADLRPIFENWGLPPRVQGGRGTCSVFTMVGALEYAKAAHEGKGARLSVEYLNWAKNIALITTIDGGNFANLWKGFLESGVCLDKDMPYRPHYDWKQGPSPEARAYAKKLERGDFHMHWIKTWDASTGITEEQYREIKQVLRDGWPVCGGFRWPKDAQWKEGVLQMAPPEGVYDGHSVLLVGYRDDPKLPGGGAFILRNSQSDRDDGMMCYEYARAYLNDALWIESAKAPAAAKAAVKSRR